MAKILTFITLHKVYIKRPGVDAVVSVNVVGGVVVCSAARCCIGRISSRGVELSLRTADALIDNWGKCLGSRNIIIV
jgi:hypothetical protein